MAVAAARPQPCAMAVTQWLLTCFKAQPHARTMAGHGSRLDSVSVTNRSSWSWFSLRDAMIDGGVWVRGDQEAARAGRRRRDGTGGVRRGATQTAATAAAAVAAREGGGRVRESWVTRV